MFRAPSDREAVDLALPSLRAFVPDIEKDDISILKSYQKDADTIVVLKAGGIICEMPLIESKNGWIGRGINCDGQFESPKKAEARRKKKVIAEITASIEETNRKSPFVSDRNVRHDKSEFDPETLTVRLYFTDHGSKRTAMSQKLLEAVKEMAIAENCNYLRYMMRNGVTVEHYVRMDYGFFIPYLIDLPEVKGNCAGEVVILLHPLASAVIGEGEIGLGCSPSYPP